MQQRILISSNLTSNKRIKRFKPSPINSKRQILTLLNLHHRKPLRHIKRNTNLTRIKHLPTSRQHHTTQPLITLLLSPTRTQPSTKRHTTISQLLLSLINLSLQPRNSLLIRNRKRQMRSKISTRTHHTTLSVRNLTHISLLQPSTLKRTRLSSTLIRSPSSSSLRSLILHTSIRRQPPNLIRRQTQRNNTSNNILPRTKRITCTHPRISQLFLSSTKHANKLVITILTSKPLANLQINKHPIIRTLKLLSTLLRPRLTPTTLTRHRDNRRSLSLQPPLRSNKLRHRSITLITQRFSRLL